MKLLLPIVALSVALAGFVSASPPVNEECPVCGKPGRLIYRSYYHGSNTTFKDKNIIFATSECKEKFDKEPDKYVTKIKPKDP